jgi:hypothetical protein
MTLFVTSSCLNTFMMNGLYGLIYIALCLNVQGGLHIGKGENQAQSLQLTCLKAIYLHVSCPHYLCACVSSLSVLAAMVGTDCFSYLSNTKKILAMSEKACYVGSRLAIGGSRVKTAIRWIHSLSLCCDSVSSVTHASFTIVPNVVVQFV